jgi:hypothetical protein
MSSPISNTYVSGDCWLYNWIDEFGITTREEVKRAIKSPQAISRLFGIAVDAVAPYEPREFSGHAALVAGQGFNLSGEATCSSFRCVRQEIDQIMSKAWHYFDRIVVAGPSPRNLALQIAETPKKARSYFNWVLENEVRTLLYLREIGATSWLEFVPNSNMSHCEECTRHVAAESGLSSAFDESVRNEIVSQLEREARIVVKRQEGLWNADIEHPFLVEAMSFKFTKRPDRRRVAENVYDTYNSATVKDFVKSRMLNLPLAATVQADWLTSSMGSHNDAVEDRMGRVALRLELPVVEGLLGQDLLAFIEDEREPFIAFRSALRKAIEENLKRLDSKSDAEVAEAVKREYIEPEIAKISAHLNGARKSLTKKVVAGVGVGALVTSVGLFAAMPLIIGAGIAAAATPLPQVYKYFDDSTSIEVSDMYFLWKMQRTWRH